jgi:hypothetical protein
LVSNAIILVVAFLAAVGLIVMIPKGFAGDNLVAVFAH